MDIYFAHRGFHPPLTPSRWVYQLALFDCILNCFDFFLYGALMSAQFYGSWSVVDTFLLLQALIAAVVYLVGLKSPRNVHMTWYFDKHRDKHYHQFHLQSQQTFQVGKHSSRKKFNRVGVQISEREIFSNRIGTLLKKRFFSKNLIDVCFSLKNTNFKL